MAGDWIKVESATLDKPEVYRIADLLGVTPDQTLGLLLRFWVWLDRNSCNGRVTLMYAKSIDTVMRCDGFAACLVDVGWAAVDDSAGVLTITNFDRHNGKSAKTRASTQQRVQRHRNAVVTPEPLPEKRREEIKELPRKRGTRLPEDWVIPDDWVAWALAERKDWTAPHVLGVAAQFADYWRGKGETRADWLATWRNWVRRDKSVPLQIVGGAHRHSKVQL